MTAQQLSTVSNAVSSFVDNGLNSGYLQRVFDPSLVSMQYNSAEAMKAREFSAQQAQIQRDFEERMSSTAYQRAAADMRAAGLNPYAVYGGASAASTPSGVAGSAYQASTHGGESSRAFQGLLSSALSLGMAYLTKGASKALSKTVDVFHHY